MVIGDTHFPFHSKSAYKNLISLAKDLKPTHIVQIGDVIDQYVFSSYARSVDISPKDDVDYGLAIAKTMWQELKAIVPSAKCYQLLGNHDVRIAKRISERLPELVGYFNFRNLYTFDGVKVMNSDRDYLNINGVMYVHGWLSKSIDHARYFSMPTVHGHRHRPCIEYEHKKLWSMDVGYMGDVNSLPLQYTASRFTKWTVSCGVVENGQPRIILL